MKLDRRIVLFEPGAQVRNADGSTSHGEPTQHRVFAKRQARSGSEGIVIDTAVAEYPVEYTIRSGGLDSLDTTWWLTDGGQEYRIEAVYEPNIGRRQFLALRAVLRK